MKINGEEIMIEGDMSLQAFLTERGYNCSGIAVERNGEIVPKSMYQECVLNDSDTLEIVHFVGGG